VGETLDCGEELEEKIAMQAITAMLAAFLFLKTGEKFATQEMAGPTVAAFLAQVGKGMDGVTFEAQVLNDPAKAVAFCAKKKPAVGIVTPGFYLAYQKALGMEPLLEVRRQKVVAERYVVVVKKEAGDGLEAVKGKVVATTLAAEERYVIGVILQDKLGEVRLKAVTDIEGAVFDLVEGTKEAAGAVVMEEATWQAMEKDEELGPKLKVAHRSEEMPGALLVSFSASASGKEASQMKKAFQSLQDTAEGREALGSIRVEKFEDVNQERLKKVEELFLGKLQ
jgi:hypothetical protein